MPNAVTYTLQFPGRANHMLDVALEAAASTAGHVELWMPVWTPGSYLVREYSRHLQEFAAETPEGKPLPWKKTAKNRWEVETGGAARLRVRYRLYCRERSVRTNWVDEGHAMLNGAPTFLTLRGAERSPHRVRVELPQGWGNVHTALPEVDGAYLAADHEELIDSPIAAGNPAVRRFTVDKTTIELVDQGGDGLWDHDAAARDVEAVVRAYRDMYGELPLSRYVFFNMIVEGSGGLEHKNSTVLMTSRFTFRDRKKYVRWLGLVSHEFFHVWNVKRSRPVELGPFDYENEVYTRSLWVAEGLTAYYTDLIPRRAGLTTVDEYLAAISDGVTKLQNTPGRRRQSLEQSSFDAWIKLYRPDENTVNSTVSYYLKGAVVGWLLDAVLRERTQGERNLDHVMRLLFERYSGDRGFTPAEMQQTVEEIAGGSLQEFFDRAVRSTEDLDYEPALRLLGLRFRETDPTGLPWLGVDTESRGRNLFVKTVYEDGPAYRAGLQAADEILAVAGNRVGSGLLAARLRQYQPGERVVLLISRDEQIRQAPVTLGEKPRDAWRLEIDPEAPRQAAERRKGWLGSR